MHNKNQSQTNSKTNVPGCSNPDLGGKSVLRYVHLKCGQAFRFYETGAVYVRCRGGYRLGTGGPLTKFKFTAMPVILYC